MELSQKTRLWGVVVGHDLVVLLLFYEFKNRELLAFSQNRFTLAWIWQIGDTEVEVSSPANGKGHFLEDGFATVMHVYVGHLQVGAGSRLTHAMKASRDFS